MWWTYLSKITRSDTLRLQCDQRRSACCLQMHLKSIHYCSKVLFETMASDGAIGPGWSARVFQCLGLTSWGSASWNSWAPCSAFLASNASEGFWTGQGRCLSTKKALSYKALVLCAQLPLNHRTLLITSHNLSVLTLSRHYTNMLFKDPTVHLWIPSSTLNKRLLAGLIIPKNYLVG